MHLFNLARAALALTAILTSIAPATAVEIAPHRTANPTHGIAPIPQAKHAPENRNMFERVAPAFTFPGSKPTTAAALPKTSLSSRAAASPVTESQLFAAYGDSQTGFFDYGIYSLSTTAPANTQLVENIMDMDMANCAGAVYADGKFFFAEEQKAGSYVFRMNYHLYDATTWNEISNNSNDDTSFLAQDMTWDPATGNVYGVFVKKIGTESHSVFGTLNITTGAQTDIADLGSMAIRAIAATEDGRLYGIGANGILYSIDKATGSLTQVGNTGLYSEYITTGTIDPRSGIFYYYLCSDNSNSLYSVDLNTAAATKIYEFDDYATALAGMYVIAPEADPKAPAAVQNLQLEFNGASLTGFVKFTTPYTLFDDSGATGEINYTVTLNGKTALSGFTDYGTRMALPLTVEKAGEYTVGVRVTNDAGPSPLVQTSRWIGPAIPAPLTNVNLTYEAGVMHLTWDAPIALAGNGFDPDKATFRITRNPGGTTVATAHSGLSFNEQIAEPASLTEYFYEVAACFEGSESTPTQSNRIALGNIVPPFVDSFDVPSSLAKYTIVDANSDQISWEWQNLDGNGVASTGYNSSKAMDDWLFLPAANLKKGVNYLISFDVSVLASTPRHNEKLEVLIGSGPAPELLTTTIIPVTELRNTAMEEMKEFFSVTTDGLYYIALHVCSDRDMYRLYLDNLSLSAPIATTVPDAPSNLHVAPAADGSLKATITFTAPSKDIEGNDLQALSGVKIYRGETLLGESKPAIGQVGYFTDNNALEGINSYRLVPYNADGEGREATVEQYIGIAEPKAVSEVVATLGSDDGEVRLQWTPVATDINGFALTSSMVKYTINQMIDGSPVKIADNVSATSFTHRVCAPEATQQFAYYTVSATTTGGSSAQTISNMVAVGVPYEARFAESFAGGGANSIWYNMAPAYPYNGSWVGVASDIAGGYGIMPHDGDNGLLLFGGPFTGCEAYIFSGKIALTNITKPLLTFRYYDDGNSNILDVVAMTDMQSIQLLKTFTLDSTDENTGWKRATVDLSAYAGRTIQIGFRGEIARSIVIALDNIRIISDVEHNLAAIALNAPAAAKPSTDFAVTVSILNTGHNRAEGYAVDLYCNGSLVATGQGTAIESDETATVQFTHHLSPAAEAITQMHAQLRYDADADEADNTTPSSSIKVMHNSYPAVPDLTGTIAPDNEVNLSWSEPDFTGVSIAVTDDVETLEPFSIGLDSSELGAGDNIGDWTMIDADHSITYGIDAGSSDDEWVRFPNTRKEMAFMVFNQELAGVRGWDAYSGKQMFACFAATVAPNNDWLISPELTGEAQTISLMARSVSLQYPESFEVLYSTSGKTIADFKLVEAIATVPANWTEYRFDLPKNSRYFAIRCTSYDAFALLVDYITYTGVKNPGNELSIVGYNIYRNGTLLNTEPIMEPEYTDRTSRQPMSDYRVTVVYNLGESAPSNSFIAESGSANMASFSEGNINITTSHGEAIITGAEDLTAIIYATDGTLVKKVVCGATTRIKLLPGIYLVKVAGVHATKVVIR